MPGPDPSPGSLRFGAATMALPRVVVVSNATPEVTPAGQDKSARRAIDQAKVIASGEIVRFIASRGAEGTAIPGIAAPVHL